MTDKTCKNCKHFYKEPVYFEGDILLCGKKEPEFTIYLGFETVEDPEDYKICEDFECKHFEKVEE